MENELIIPAQEWNSEEIRKSLILYSSTMCPSVGENDNEIIIKLKKEIKDIENKINNKNND